MDLVLVAVCLLHALPPSSLAVEISGAVVPATKE
jgi:hypothetical protein